MIGGLVRRAGPIARLSLGLVALLVSLALVADMLLGVVPGRGDTERRIRQRVAETLALQITALVEAGDTALLGRTLQQVMARDTRIRSIAVARSDGTEILRRGVEPGADGVADPLMRVPISAGRERWGEIEIRFAAEEAAWPWGWLKQPAVQMLLVLVIGGFALCYAYLWRAMHFLNPSASVPDRVRRAFDALAEGLLIVDQQQRIVLANRAFRQLHPQADAELNGQRIDTLGWLLQGFAAAAPDAAGPAAGEAAGTTGAEPATAAPAPLPWVHTLQTGTPVSARPLQVLRPNDDTAQLLVSTAAVTDNKGRARGCLITFDNVTAVHRANAELRGALEALEHSRRRIEEQNVELRQLASRDGLTGCYNRRAFFELAKEQFNAAREHHTELCCLMVDIDHFKRFNDTYGHAVGDQVIQVVSRALAAGLRQPDLLGRYGGEEFCIVLPAAGAQVACAVAERMRTSIETTARSAIRGIQVVPITASFGVAVLQPGTVSIEALIEQADQALYRAKETGRNRVVLYEVTT
jgi:diguanylate cyclase (GGDEF)-like protein